MQSKEEPLKSAIQIELQEELRGSGAPPISEAGLFTATVVGASGQDVILELAPHVQGAVPVEEFDELPATGSQLQVLPTGREDTLWTFSVKAARTLSTWEEMEVGSLAKGKVIGVNRGGIELKVSGINAFMPASQIALTHVEDLFAYVGQTMIAEVKEIDREKRRIVVSRRAVLESERRLQQVETSSALVEGSTLTGKVVRLEPFGAFVDIGGVEGLLHVSNISHRRVENPEEVLKKGQDVNVMVLKIEDGGRRIGLGMKQLETDPWEDACERFQEDQVVQGTVQRLVDFGAFVEIMPGVDGLLHVSQLGQGRVRSASDVLKLGEELSVRIVSMDYGSRRISLSRLDTRGALLGSEEAVDGDEIDAVIEAGQTLKTSLGSLFDALKQKED